jgi:hypothetical protein
MPSKRPFLKTWQYQRRSKFALAAIVSLSAGLVGYQLLRGSFAVSSFSGTCISGTTSFSVSGPSTNSAQDNKRFLSFAIFPPYPSPDPTIYTPSTNYVWQGAAVPFTSNTNGTQFRWYTYTENGGGGGIYEGTSQCTDTVAPSAPPSFTVSTSTNYVNMSWGASSDATGVSGYRVYRGSTQLGSTNAATRSFAVNNHPSGTYTFSVQAVDGAGNISAASSRTATVPAPTPLPTSPTPPPNPGSPQPNQSPPLQGSSNTTTNPEAEVTPTDTPITTSAEPTYGANLAESSNDTPLAPAKKPKSTVLVVFVSLLLLAGLAGLGYVSFLYYRRRHALVSQYEDYYRKERGY